MSGRSTIDTATDGALEFEVAARGNGPPLLILPSLTPAAGAELAAGLAAEGLQVIRPWPRGVAPGVTFEGVAAQVVQLISTAPAKPAILIGEGLGAALAASIAADRPDLVRGIVVAVGPAGGMAAKPHPLTPEKLRDWRASSAPILEIRGSDQTFQPGPARTALQATVGARATAVYVPNTSQSVLAEHPAATVQAITDWLGGTAVARSEEGARITYPPEPEAEPPAKSRNPLLASSGLPAGGPTHLFKHNPELSAAWVAFSNVVTSNHALPHRYRELAILVIARAWTSQFEWIAHDMLARSAGVDPAIIEAIRLNRRPEFGKADEEIIYNYVLEAMHTGRAGDAAYRRAWEMLGTVGLLNLTIVIGHYLNVAATLNAHDTIPPGVEPMLSPI